MSGVLGLANLFRVVATFFQVLTRVWCSCDAIACVAGLVNREHTTSIQLIVHVNMTQRPMPRAITTYPRRASVITNGLLMMHFACAMSLYHAITHRCLITSCVLVNDSCWRQLASSAAARSDAIM
jgi:hypothetical protein